MKTPKVYALWILAGLVLLLSACAGASPPAEPASEAGAGVPTVEAGVTVSAPEEGEAGEPAEAPASEGSPREVTFVTADGVTLGGTLFGTGDTAIVLSHMFPTDQTSWHPFAQTAADQGYLVLAYDFRGYGASGGEQDIPAIDQDVRAAYDFVRAQGAQRVVLIGASMGGTASIKMAAALGDDVAGLVVLSSPQEFNGLEVTQADLDALSMPSLWMSARTDMVTPALEGMFDKAAGDKSLWIFEGSGAHGTFIFDAPLDGQDLERRLLEFLSRVAPVS